jgi:predicted 3-demethylubiquinone-9 3-methyltransferase (glyoxalase superfamily)
MTAITPCLWFDDQAEPLLADKDPAKSARVMQALLKMVKIDIAALQKAHAGK